MRRNKLLIYICWGVFIFLTEACFSAKVGGDNNGNISVGWKSEIFAPEYNHYYSEETINYYITYHTEVIEAIEKEIIRTERSGSSSPNNSSTKPPTNSTPQDELNTRLRRAQDAKRKWQELLRSSSFIDYESLPTVRLANAAELPFLIKSNVNIVIRPGTYKVPPLILESIRNFSLSSSGPGTVKLVSQDPFSPVINVQNSTNVRLKGLVLGHELPVASKDSEGLEYHGGCGGPWVEDGAVLYFYNSQQVDISQCKLFGCGTYGIYTRWSGEIGAKISVFNSEIYECTHAAINLESQSQNLSFCRGIIYNNTVEEDLLKVSYGSRLHIADSQIFNNRTSENSNLISVTNLENEKSELVLDACTVTVNTFKGLSNNPDLTVFRNTNFSNNFFNGQ